MLREFYANGKPKCIGKVSDFEPTLKYQGNLVTYRRNGTMESTVNYINGNKTGPGFYFFENRKVKKELEYKVNLWKENVLESNVDVSIAKLVFQSDSLGNILVQDGNGYVKESNFVDGDNFFEEGKYSNGFKDSLWVGRFASGKSAYQELYENERLVWGKNTVGDTIYNYTGNDGPPQFKGGIKIFYNFIGQTLRYPETAVKYNIQGKVVAAFTIDKAGKVDEIEIIR